MDKLGLDLDDVVFATCDAVIPFFNQRFGTDVGYEQVTNYKLSEVFGVSPKEIGRVYRDFHDGGGFLSLGFVEGALEVLPSLAQEFELHALTSRPLYTRDHTLISMRRLPVWFNEVHFTAHPTDLASTTAEAEKKSDVCVRLGIGSIVDDCVEHNIDCAGAGIRALLFDLGGKYTWNQGYSANGVERVASWREVEDKLLK